MNPLPLWIKEIENQVQGNPILPVLLVEGDDDVVLFRYFFGQHSPGWDLRLRLASAGGKQHVISGVAVHHPDWIGVVDLDEWSPAELQEAVARSPRLHALPRFCIESYFCHPLELWDALPPTRRAHLNDDPQNLADPIGAALPNWTAHGAMWRVLRRLSRGLPARLENEPVTDEVEIRQILQGWHDQLAPDKVIEQYHQELDIAGQLSSDEQLTRYIHGKKFYRCVVVPTLNRLFSQQSADGWLDIFRGGNIQPPQDLRMLLDWVVSLVT